MTGRRLTPKDISAARFQQEVFNSRIKRGEIDTNTYVREHYVVCGCGVEGCGFITRWLKKHHVDLKAEHEKYNQWLEYVATSGLVNMKEAGDGIYVLRYKKKV